MAGIRSVGVALDCDRCKPKKPVVINDADQADFYRAHAERGEDRQDVRMFVAILNTPDGQTVGIDFEYLCPKCCDTIFGYMGKMDTALAPKKNGKDKGEEKKDPPADPPEIKARKEKPKDPPPADPPETKIEEKKVTIIDERGEEPPPADPTPPTDVKPGADFVDEDLFA